MTESAFDPHDLQHFVVAQAPVFDTALAEIADGRKRSHWMWFVFPQWHGLGSSAMAQRYAIRSLDEARAYLQHPTLGRRLREGVDRVLSLHGRDIHAVFGSPDDRKLASSMTLFERAAPEDPRFGAVLDAFYGGERDRLTLDRIDAD